MKFIILHFIIVALISCNKKLNTTTKGDLGEASKAPVDQGGGGDPSDNPLVERFLKLVAEVSDRAPELNREKDRRYKLLSELGANLSEGCLSDVLVHTITLSSEGRSLPNIDVTSAAKTEKNLSINEEPSKFQIKIGNSVSGKVQTISHNEDGQDVEGSLFNAAGSLSIKVTEENFKIRDLAFIKIEKPTPGYAITMKSGKCSTKDWNPDKCKVEDIKKIEEQGRFQLDQLKIIVNNIYEVYVNRYMNQVFSKHAGDVEKSSVGLFWSDDQILTNEAYAKVLQNNDCSQ